MASSTSKHPDPPARKHDEPFESPKPPASLDPQEAKLARDAPVVLGATGATGAHATIGDEQRARSAEMELAGGPEAWMKAQASPPPEADVEKKTVAGTNEKK